VSAVGTKSNPVLSSSSSTAAAEAALQRNSR
jgi:hypothetical protein